ncbi:MAG TPA: NAD(P)-dependent oxidoreductase [Ktedonobacteraceae bacterium]|nr:NAD(P)-dependent oxidoreductase [Ktedonobacteraceae bacterium]
MEKDSLVRRTILLTGAAGRIGSAFVAYADENMHYHFRLADRIHEGLATLSHGEHEQVHLDVADLEACQQACRGIDMVVHLAADPSPDAQFYDTLLETNIKGTYNIFRAAKDQGCRRVIFASSAQAVEAYPLDTQVQPQMAVRPKNLYGVSKCFGEALAAYFAYNEGLSCIAIRIGAFDEKPAPGQHLSARDLSAYISPRDLCQLLVQCIETPALPFALVHGISNNRFKRLDLTSTQELLSYHPEDDAFQLFHTGLQG